MSGSLCESDTAGMHKSLCCEGHGRDCILIFAKILERAFVVECTTAGTGRNESGGTVMCSW